MTRFHPWIHTLLPSEHTVSGMRWGLLAMGALVFTVVELGLGPLSEQEPKSERRSISSSSPFPGQALPTESDWSSVAF